MNPPDFAEKISEKLADFTPVPVGVSLLAIASGQAPKMSTALTLSRAGSLLQGIVVGRKI
ncbi:hypothetical protein BK671_09955 [Pseudomonas fluorescens]|uniref:Uncharacterized protein n=1 Tax=Pseudomonas fluorescens TaxID=294 RepID=A0A423LN38_PSEFL|nr:hypothetical protein BK671_09955 [Pseudomonas fluorescens]